MSELTDAIKQGDAGKIEELIGADPALASKAENNVTPLLLAVYHGKTDIARLLIDRGATVSFGEAVALGDTDRVKKLLADDPQLLHSRTPDGFFAVGLAIFLRHGELARWLIEQGADIHAPADNPMKVAPVHAAAAACDRETM